MCGPSWTQMEMGERVYELDSHAARRLGEHIGASRRHRRAPTGLDHTSAASRSQ
jgi:hypothetical protein